MSTVMTNDTKTDRVPGIANYYIGIAVDIVLLYAINNLVYFEIPFLTDQLISCLWAVNLALGMGIMGNFILLIYRPHWFYHLVQFMMNALFILALYVLLRIFPFNISQSILQSTLKVTLIVVMSGIGIASFVEIVKFVITIFRKTTQPGLTLPDDIPPES